MGTDGHRGTYDYPPTHQTLLPKNTVFHCGKRGRKRRRMEKDVASSNNEENRCTKVVVDKAVALAGTPEGGPSLAAWFKARKAVGSPARQVIKVTRDAVYIKGRYQKLSRQLPQSAWVVHGSRIGKGSVEEIVVQPIKEWCRAESCGFMGAGREDMDVRMLGTGRPFLIQVNDPRRVPRTSSDLSWLQDEINKEQGLNAQGDVIVTDLVMSDKAEVKAMHEAAEDKQKFYTCLVWLSKALPYHTIADTLQPIKDLTLQQKTPVRVLHRRSLLTRARVIHEMRCEPINQRFFTLHVRASAGTYIKEFVHGDLGRTEPSVGSLLGCRADILQLDVTDVIIPQLQQKQQQGGQK